MSTYGVFSVPYFPVFGLNTEIYGVNLRIQSEYRKMQTRKNSVFGHFSRSETTMNKAKNFIKNFIKKTLVKKSIFLRKSAFAERAVMFLKNRKKYFS